jgi:hypothetical protein
MPVRCHGKIENGEKWFYFVERCKHNIIFTENIQMALYLSNKTSEDHNYFDD